MNLSEGSPTTPMRPASKPPLFKSKGLFLLLCALVFQLPRLHAAGPFTVSFNDDNPGEEGNLRQEILDSNAAGGANTVSWLSGSGGAITILGDLSGINANTTLDVTAAVSTVTIAGAFNVPLLGAVTFRNDNAAINWPSAPTSAAPGP